MYMTCDRVMTAEGKNTVGQTSSIVQDEVEINNKKLDRNPNIQIDSAGKGLL